MVFVKNVQIPSAQWTAQSAWGSFSQENRGISSAGEMGAYSVIYPASRASCPTSSWAE